MHKLWLKDHHRLAMDLIFLAQKASTVLQPLWPIAWDRMSVFDFAELFKSS